MNVRDINEDNHAIIKYVKLDIYLSDLKNNKRVQILIIREIYIINNLRVKLLIGIDIIRPKIIDIFILKRIITVGNCGIDLFIKIYLKKTFIRRII